MISRSFAASMTFTRLQTQCERKENKTQAARFWACGQKHPLKTFGVTKKPKLGCRNDCSEIVLNSRSVAYLENFMAPRANWKGFLRLSLVTCPVALYPATSDSEKISFNQINRNTGHRIKYAKEDADTGEEVSNEDITKGYKVDTDTYVEVSKDELENIALESTRTIDIDEFVPKSSIDPRYLIRPYYLVPDGKVGHDALRSFERRSAAWIKSLSGVSS